MSTATSDDHSWFSMSWMIPYYTKLHPKHHIELGAIIMCSNITWYCIKGWAINTSRNWIHKRHPIPNPNGLAIKCLPIVVIFSKKHWACYKAMHLLCINGVIFPLLITLTGISIWCEMERGSSINSIIPSARYNQNCENLWLIRIMMMSARFINLTHWGLKKWTPFHRCFACIFCNEN